ncbi:DEAD/DEAH box helicase family protein [Pseudonocardia sp. MH-G8]|uniref:DEAD/DEAH box helicase family protein n=1 Tax=Pseudonocardia sp. MH-G8 TaxID=1854588 RepID=UPI00130428A1|nr:DEAD/DEAH box helicase family protein [Pseudonocardia sp. MH-G8]
MIDDGVGGLTDVAGRFATLRPGVSLRPHQLDALDGLAGVLAEQRRAWVVLPPGAGKTVVGLEAARRLGRPIVAFAPNTAIQGQWLAEWARFVPEPPPGSSDRALDAPLTALTYQSLASFDPDAEVDADGRDRDPHIRRLRPAGRELVDALGRQPVTLLLDECHHLLDVWGELLAEVLERLPDATVIGLTATPPDALTQAERVLVDRLFGRLVTGPSIPAMVRDGLLAPYAELARITVPTGREETWLATQAERFDALTSDLLDPGFAGVGFLPWLDRSVVRREHHAGEGPAVPWHRFARERPETADAALRFHHASLLALPEGARLHERHRRPPDSDDWMQLLHLYVHQFLARSHDPRDEHAHAAIREALRGFGYRITRGGIRAGRSPVDRVLARSSAKIDSACRILADEHQNLGERLRAVVVCDHEQARATVPAGLVGVLDDEAGSARLALRLLQRELPDLRPVLVTGRTVAADAGVARALVSYAAEVAPELRLAPVPVDAAGVVEVRGSWTSRQWVPLVTRYFESGASLTLIGTRALLGEGWDCAVVNTLVDLTEATTATSVVQLRGRALRLDPEQPDKVAHTWSVVCVDRRHPKGAADYARFVRKHDGYYGATEHGVVLAGVAHVDAGLSAFGPPSVAALEEVEQRMLRRCRDRDRTRELWRIGEPYADRPAHAVRVVTPAAVRDLPPQPPAVVPAATGLSTDARSVRWLVDTVLVVASTATLLGTGPGVAGLLLVLATLVSLGTHVRHAHERGRRLREVARSSPDLTAMAYATADALHTAGLTDRGADAVTVEPDGSGAWQFHLTGVDADASQRYATALDEVLSAPADPRYLIGRYVVPDPGDGRWAAVRAGWRAPRDPRLAIARHAVPTVLGDKRERADAFGIAWWCWVSQGAGPIYTRSTEGALLLAACRGLSPLDAHTALRITWE